MTTLSRIRQKVIDRQYYLSTHAERKMAADDLERRVVENTILRGKIDKKMTRDVRGARHRIAGPAEDGRLAHVVCRCRDVGGLIIITVYTVGGEQ